jgi:hypothetical protein
VVPPEDGGKDEVALVVPPAWPPVWVEVPEVVPPTVPPVWFEAPGIVPPLEALVRPPPLPPGAVTPPADPSSAIVEVLLLHARPITDTNAIAPLVIFMAMNTPRKNDC